MSLDLQNSNCLQCEGLNHYLQKSRSYQCVSQCENDYSSEPQNFSCDLKIYQQKSCIYPYGQYYDQECVCPDGLYKDNNQCKECPDYCVRCISSTKCIEYYGIPRNENGQCEVGEYDDGKSCISDFIIIPNTQNAQLLFQTQNLVCNTSPTQINKDDFSFKDASLFVGTQSDSFFLTFSFNLQLNSPYNQNNYYTLFYLTNEEYHLFTLAAKAISNDDMTFILIQEYQSSQIDIISGHLDTNTEVQIGFYTNLSDVSLIVQYPNSPQSFYKSKFQKMYPILLKPELVFAKSSPIFSSYLYPCQFLGKLGSNNVLFKGHYTMFKFERLLKALLESDLINVLNFNFCEFSSEEILSSSSVKNKFDNNLFLQLSKINYGFSQIQGIKLSDSAEGSIYLDSKLDFSKPVVIQMSFSGYFIHGYEFFNIIFNQQALIYFQATFLYFSSQQFEICILGECKKLSQGKMFYMNPNFLSNKIEIFYKTNIFIFKLVVKISSMKYPSGLEIVKFEVVLNYRTDELEFVFPLSQYISSKLLIKIGSQKATAGFLFLSDLQIYQGGYFYIKYENNNPCLIYINKSDMKCIIPKQGYAIKNNLAIPNSHCNYGEDFNSPILFFNPYALKCQNSNVIIPFCLEMIFSNLNQCTKCFDQTYMDVSKNCECIQGMYLDKVTQKCKCKLLLFVCSKVCKSCSINENNCTQCMEQSLIPPNCNCLLSNQFRSSQYLCENCDIQCDRCFGNSSTCISCSYGRINPPICFCDPDTYMNYLIDSISKACEKIQCQNKCKTCSKKPENCIQCKGDRVNPPICNCPTGLYDPINQNNEFCLKCPSNFYYDIQFNKCIQCNQFCNTCFGPNINNCLSCHSNYKLNQQNQCFCKEGSSPVIDQNNYSQCFKNMDIIQNIYIKNNQYSILINFEYEIDYIESIIQKFGINLVFSFTIGQINPDYYSIISYSFPKYDQIILNIEIKKNIYRTSGQLSFLKSNIFQNYKNQAVLNPVYLKQPFQFEIGPYFTETKLQIGVKLASALNQQTIDFIRNIQFLFYFINSAQPTVMLLLVDIQIPPNFYNFLSEIGQLVFRNVSEYNQIHFQNYYSFGGQNITSYVKPTKIYQFDRVGFCNSYLANAEFIFYKYLICLFLFFIFKITQALYLQKRYQQIIKKFFMNRLIAETEINFLMNFLSIMIQFLNIQQEEDLSRQNLYASIFVLLIIFSFQLQFYKEYNKQRLNQEKDFFNILEGKLDKNRVNSCWSVKNFYFVCLFKKIVLILVIFCLYKNSVSVCFIFSIINLISGIYILYLRPHDFLFRNILKALADIIISVVWIFMILFNQQFKNLQGDIVLNDDQVDSIMAKGFTASLMTLAYNLIFLLIFLIEIVLLLQDLMKKKKGINLVIEMKGTQQSEDQSIQIGHQSEDNHDLKINKKIIYENDKT